MSRPLPYAINILLLAICLFACACKKSDSSPENPNKPYHTDPSWKEPLAKGINLSNWFNDYSDPTQFDDRFTDAHFQLLHDLGFTYVRIPVGQTILFNRNNPSQLQSANLAYVEAAVQRAVDHGLAAMINFHPLTTDFEKTLPTSKGNQDLLAAYWKAVAGHFKKFSTTEVFFEVYNEPHVASDGSLNNIGKTWWSAVQLKLIQAIRSATPDHFIIAGGESWNSIEGLRLLMPYRENNIVYNFHFYDPFVFTHQGATWAGEQMAKLRDVPYPSTPELVAPIVDTATDTNVREMVAWYGEERWNKDLLSTRMQPAVDWATAHKAALICNEFGSYMEFAPRESRLRHIRDIRSILEEKNIGWAMWEMDEGFGFINYNGSDRTSFTTDDEVLQALGLK